jgi:SAM-dependent methyltransferase
MVPPTGSMASDTTSSDPDRWFSDWFQEDYLVLYQHRGVEEARGFLDHILPELTPKPSGWVLDLACGAGRHSHYLASLGFSVVGLDLSKPLLVRAMKTITPSKIPWIQADMRSIPLRNESVSLVMSMFTSFGYFLNDREDILVLKEVSRVLVPESWLILDTLNPGYVEKTLVPHSERWQRDMTIIEEREIDRTRRRVNKTIRLRRGNQEKAFMESVRMYSVDELTQLLTSVSCAPRILWGDYNGSKYFPQSPRLIIAAQKYATDTV